MAQTIRTRKPPQALSPEWSWTTRPQRATLRGGVLAINGTAYQVEPIEAGYDNADGDPCFDGFRLRKPDGTVHDVSTTGERFVCDCPDATFQPERPGGCKHCVALRGAMAQLGQLPPDCAGGRSRTESPAKPVCTVCHDDGVYFEDGGMFPCYECDSRGQPERYQSRQEVPAERAAFEARHQADCDRATLTRWAEATLWAGPPCTCHDGTCIRCQVEEVVARTGGGYQAMRETTPF